jgi:lipoate-protein ligase A
MNRLVVLKSEVLNPHENLKVEESILNSTPLFTGILVLWRNEPCVVIGKFQKEEYEVNINYVKAKGIPIIRRYTGGGTVYHDLGNLNITFCKGRNDFIFSSFFIEEGRGITEIIASTLKDFVKENVEIDKRNAIFVNGKKISGSSIAITKDNFFYHSTLLVNSDIEELKRVIRWDENYPEGTSCFVKSNRSEVANLSDFSKNISIERIKESIIKKFGKVLGLKAEVNSVIGGWQGPARF